MKIFFIFSLISILTLTACATTPPPRSGVREARACMNILNHNPRAIENYVIKACSHNGIWLADLEDANGLLLAKYDFVNREYAGPETGGGFLSVQSLSQAVQGQFFKIQTELNQKLLAEGV